LSVTCACADAGRAMTGAATAALVAARNLRREMVIAVLPECASVGCKQMPPIFQCSDAKIAGFEPCGADMVDAAVFLESPWRCA
jgi:hypothetical protein